MHQSVAMMHYSVTDVIPDSDAEGLKTHFARSGQSGSDGKLCV